MISAKVKLGIVAVAGAVLLVFAGVNDLQGGASKNNVTKIAAEPGQGGADDWFGYSVSTDGYFAVAGAPFTDSTGAIFLSAYDGDNWSPTEKKQPLFPLDTGDEFGTSVAIDGDWIIVGAPKDDDRGLDAGAAYMFKRVGGGWDFSSKLVDSSAVEDDLFGTSVDIHGDYAIVGALCCNNYKGGAHIFKRYGDVWVWRAKLSAQNGQENDYLGISVSITDDYAVAGAKEAKIDELRIGAAFVYEKPAGRWVSANETAILTASDPGVYDLFGASVSSRGGLVCVGAPHASGRADSSGAVYVFEEPSGGWATTSTCDKLTASDGALLDNFGRSVSTDGLNVYAGAPGVDGIMGADIGSIYVFDDRSGSWRERSLRAPDGLADDMLGSSVAIGDFLIAGAKEEDSMIGHDAGAAYIYEGAIHEDRYFVHLADLHVKHDDNVMWPFKASTRWEKELKEVLKLRPPPEFVVVSGDLVDYGEKSKGRKNYNRLVGSSVLDIHPDTGIHYLYDTDHSIRIVFAPGNHDYRRKKYGPTRTTLSNYRDKIYDGYYYHDIIRDKYAVFSVDTRYDWFEDINPTLPEGRGITDYYLDRLGRNIDSLDGENDGADDGRYVKVVFMHHPHESRREGPKDGEFLDNNSGFVSLCKQYGVNFVLYGHTHENDSFWLSRTKCYITDAAKDGHHRRASVNSADAWGEVDRLFSVINIRYEGNVEPWAADQWEDTTRYHYGVADTLVRLGIPESDLYGYDERDEYGFPTFRYSDLSVLKADTMNYQFVAEAFAEDEITITIEEKNADGTTREIVYRDVPMYYDGGQNPKGSIATILAPASQVDYTLRIVDPGGVARDDVLPETQWIVRAVDLFQDTFPMNGTSVGEGRIDAAVDIAPEGSLSIIPGDSAVVTVFDPGFGIRDPDPYPGGGAAVYLYVSRDAGNDPVNDPMPVDKIVEDSSRWPLVDSLVTPGRTWYMLRADTCFSEFDGPRTGPVADRFCVDINDNYFTNGDTLWFFFGAENGDMPGQWSWWTEESGTVTDIDLAGATAMEMQILPGAGPARGGDILFVNNFGAGAERAHFDWAFEMLGIGDQVDRFDKRGAAYCEGNSLGGHVTDVSGQLIQNYRNIIWNSGDEAAGTVGDGSGIPEKADDLAVLYQFIDEHDDGAGVGIALSGNNLAEELAAQGGSSAVEFRETWMPFRLDDRDFVADFGVNPYAVGETGGMFDHVGWLDTVIAYSGDLDTNSFDVILPIGSTTLEMSYQSPLSIPGGAVVAFDSTNANANTARVVLSGFSYHYIYDDAPAGVPNRAEHLGDILAWLGNDPGQPVGAAETPAFMNSLSQNYPNPFNPTTTIRYSIAQPGPVSLRVYNVAGQLVKTLVNEKQRPQAGGFTIKWDGRNNNGSRVSSGVYFYQLVTDSFTRARKMVLLQ